MIRGLGLIPLLLFPGPLVTAAVAQPSSIEVFIGAAAQGEFIDTTKEIQDSIKDLTGRMRGTKGVIFVASRDGADVVVTVVARGVGSVPYGQRLEYQEFLYRGAELTSVPITVKTWWVAAVLDVPIASHRKEFVGALYTSAWNGVLRRRVA